MGRHTTIELRNLIIEEIWNMINKNGKSEREIAKIVKKARTIVENNIHGLKMKIE